jgi:hypothetical protein
LIVNKYKFSTSIRLQAVFKRDVKQTCTATANSTHFFNPIFRNLLSTDTMYLRKKVTECTWFITLTDSKFKVSRKEKEKIIYTDQQKKRYKGLIAQYFLQIDKNRIFIDALFCKLHYDFDGNRLPTLSKQISFSEFIIDRYDVSA